MLFALGWSGIGIIGGEMLSYPGDGFNERHAFGAFLGPIAFALAVWERAFPD